MLSWSTHTFGHTATRTLHQSMVIQYKCTKSRCISKSLTVSTVELVIFYLKLVIKASSEAQNMVQQFLDHFSALTLLTPHFDGKEQDKYARIAATVIHDSQQLSDA